MATLASGMCSAWPLGRSTTPAYNVSGARHLQLSVSPALGVSGARPLGRFSESSTQLLRRMAELELSRFSTRSLQRSVSSALDHSVSSVRPLQCPACPAFGDSSARHLPCSGTLVLGVSDAQRLPHLVTWALKRVQHLADQALGDFGTRPAWLIIVPRSATSALGGSHD